MVEGTLDPVCFHKSQRLGIFAHLTDCVLLSKACCERGLEPYFFISGDVAVHAGLSRNALSYCFDQINLPRGEQRRCYASVLEGNCVSIRTRYDINIYARGDAHAEISNELATIEEGRRLFERNFRFKPWLGKLVDRFWNSNMRDHRVLGLHYRGTDKFGNETDIIAHESAISVVADMIASGYERVFVATDDREFFETARERLGNKMIWFRAPKGTLSHFEDRENNFRKAAEAVVDSLLLSRCACLVKTPSLLSAWCKVFNPALRIVAIGRPYQHPYGEADLIGFGYWPERCLHPAP